MQRLTWDDVSNAVLTLPPHQEILVPKSRISNPKKAGFVRSLGLRKGQRRDYRKRVGQHGLHVREYKKVYKVHWDTYYPHRPVGFVKHVWTEDPNGPLKMGITGGIGGAGLTYLLYRLLKRARR